MLKTLTAFPIRDISQDLGYYKRLKFWQKTISYRGVYQCYSINSIIFRKMSLI